MILKYLEIIVREFLLCIIRAIVSPVFYFRRENFKKTKIKGILINVIKAPGLGNMILLSPLLNNLKRYFPNAEVFLLISSDRSKRYLDSLGFIEKVVVAPQLKNCSVLEGIRFYKKIIIPLKIDFSIGTYLQTQYWFSIWNFFSGAKYRLGYYSKRKGVFDTFSVKAELNNHEVDNHLNALRSLGVRELVEEPIFHVAEKDIQYAQNLLSSHYLGSRDKLVVMHPGAAGGWLGLKKWPVERFIDVAKRLHEEQICKVVFLCGPDDKVEANAIRSANQPYLLLFDSLDLGVLGAVISMCDVFLSNDNGPMHIAVALKRPIVGIFGPTLPQKNGPWLVKHKVITANLPCQPCYDLINPITCNQEVQFNCLLSVKVEDVYNTVCDFLRD